MLLPWRVFVSVTNQGAAKIRRSKPSSSSSTRAAKAGSGELAVAKVTPMMALAAWCLSRSMGL